MLDDRSRDIWIFNIAPFRAGYEEYAGLECTITDESIDIRSEVDKTASTRYTRELFRFVQKSKTGDLVLLCNTHFVVSRIGTISEKDEQEPLFEKISNVDSVQVKWLEATVPYVTWYPLLKANRLVRKVSASNVSGRLHRVFLDTLTSDTVSSFVLDFRVRLPIADEESREMVASGEPQARPKERAEDKGGSIELFYGTNREATISNTRYNDFYSDKPGPLRTGICWVNIPDGHSRGDIERPKWWKLKFSENVNNHFMLVGLEELSAALFMSTMRSRFQTRHCSEALLFVHGYNVDFKQAAWRTAQLVYDLSFKGVGAFYSWPSAGTLGGYFHDLQQARNNIPDFASFLRLLLNVSGIEKLHIIAHSMGSYILAYSIGNLASDAGIQGKLSIVRQLVLCAPDIDQIEFDQQVYPDFRSVGSRRTLYANDKDRAIDISEWVRKKLIRLGDAGRNLFVRKDIDTVDATRVSTGLLGHGYFADNRELINDLFMITRHELAPTKRNLVQKQHTSGFPYWEFPP